MTAEPRVHLHDGKWGRRAGDLAARLARHHAGIDTEECRLCSGRSPRDQSPIGYVKADARGEIMFRQGHPANFGPGWMPVYA